MVYLTSDSRILSFFSQLILYQNIYFTQFMRKASIIRESVKITNTRSIGIITRILKT